jgi:PAS domain S-box-containing protein
MKPRVLIVEDEALIAADLQQRLEQLDYDIVGTSDSAGKAIVLAGVYMPDIVLMDIRLRGAGDGVEAAESIRQNLGIPVIFLTAYSDSQTLERVKPTYPYSYLVKPVRDRELVANITLALHQRETTRQMHTAEAWTSAVLYGIDEPVLTVGADGTVRHANRAAERLFGTSPRPLNGQPVRELLDTDGDIVTDALLNGDTLHTSVNVKGAGEIKVECSVVPVVDGGEMHGVVIVFTLFNSRTAL